MENIEKDIFIFEEEQEVMSNTSAQAEVPEQNVEDIWKQFKSDIFRDMKLNCNGTYNPYLL